MRQRILFQKTFLPAYPIAMAYKPYVEQLQEHLKALNDNGLSVAELELDCGRWIRCHGRGDSKGRGEYSYIADTEKLNNGLLGIRTSFRGPNGAGSFKTYGLAPCGDEIVSVVCTQCNNPNSEEHELAASKAYGFWSHRTLPLEYCSGVCEDYARRNLKIAFADHERPLDVSRPAHKRSTRLPPKTRSLARGNE